MLKRFTRIVMLFLLGAILGISILYFYQERILFFPSTLEKNHVFNFSTPYSEAFLQLEDGRNIHYLTFEAQDAEGVILYFHGNAGNLSDWGTVASELAEKTNWSVWIMDYPGFGKSDGPLPKNEKVLLEIGVGLSRQLKLQHPNKPIVLFGRSVGSGISTLVATITKPSALILETPYISIAKLGHEIYPILPESFARFDLDNESNLKHLESTPTLILHGSSDQVIPFSHGEYLAKIHNNIEFIPFKDGGHNNLSRQAQYWDSLTKFLESFER